MDVSRRRITLAQLLSQQSGPSLTPYDIARISRETDSPVSHDTVAQDIERGKILQWEKRERGENYEHRIQFAEAKRYIVKRCGLACVERECSTWNATQ
jgi:hypothetical protein